MDLLIGFAVFVIVIVLIWWLLQQLPLPEPAGRIIQIVIVVVVAIVAIGFLTSYGGSGGFKFPSWK